MVIFLVLNWYFVSTKDKVSYRLKYYVIYNFLCAGCNTNYVCETYSHTSTKIHEHLKLMKVLQFTKSDKSAIQIKLR